VRVDDLFAARDRVTVSFTLTYAHDRTGKDVVMTGTKSYKFRDGKIVELWGETDVYGFLRQLGLVPRNSRRCRSPRPGRGKRLGLPGAAMPR
jgi:hypothetical protein